MLRIPRSALACLLVGLAATAPFLADPGSASAQTDVTGTRTGADGDPSGGNPPDDNGNSGGNDARSGYDLQGDNAASVYTVHDAAFTGGMGGAVDGNQGATQYTGGTGGAGLFIINPATVAVASGNFQGGVGGTATSSTETPNRLQGGDGGNGLGVFNNSGTTINGGVFTGGAGGLATGTAITDANGNGGTVTGGYGGAGLNVNSATVTVNGGTFRGGDSGPANGTAPNVNSQFAGSGLNANFNGTVYVNGGTYLGGNGATIDGGTGNGVAGDGIIGLGGNVFVRGGTFTGGAGGFGIDVFIGNISLDGTFSLTMNGVTTANYTGSIPVGTGSLTGFFDGSATQETFTYQLLDFGGTLTVLPEPTTWLGGILLAAWLLVVVSRRAHPVGIRLAAQR